LRRRFDQPGPDDLHFSTADRACDWCPFCLRRTKHGERVEPKHELQKPNELFTAGVEKAIAPCSLKAFWQYMEHKEVEELFTAHGPGSYLPGFGVKVPEGDPSVLAAQDILFPDNTPVEVSAKIDDGLMAVTDTLAINNPFPGAFFGHLQPLVNRSFQHLGPEDFSQGFVIEKVFGGLFPPQPYLLIDAGPRHEDMNVGVIIQCSGVGMEYGGKSRFASEFSVVSGKGVQGVSDTGKQKGINRLLISPGQIPELRGQGECDQVIRSGQPFVQLLFDPSAAFMVLAVWAVPVAAGMWNIGLCSTVSVRTACQHVRTVILPASGHGP